jgi:type II secretory pathway component PulM
VKRLISWAALAALTLSNPQSALAQPSGDELQALRRELEALKQGQAAIQKELQEIKALLRARPAAAPAEPRDVVLSVAEAPFKGARQAKVTLFDFSDYQ